MKVTTSQLIECFGASRRVIQNWLNDGLPIAEQGGSGRGDESVFETVAVHRWLIDRAVARAQRETPEGKLRQLQATALEIKIANESRELVSAADVEAGWTQVIIAARTELLTLADRIKARIDATYRVNIDPTLIENEVLSSLNKLSRNSPQLPVPESGGGKEQ